MLLITLFLSFLAVAFAAPASKANNAKRSPVVHPKIRWNNEFPEVLLGGSELDLNWEGGSGKYVSHSSLCCRPLYCICYVRDSVVHS